MTLYNEVRAKFGALLHWHLVNGTRPPGDPNKGREWGNQEFAGKLKRGITDKAIRNWRSGRNVPRLLDHIELALFGDAEDQLYAEWRRDLRAAYQVASRDKGVPQHKPGPSAVEQTDGVAHSFAVWEGSGEIGFSTEFERGWLVNLALGYAALVRFAGTTSHMSERDYLALVNLTLEPCQHLKIEYAGLPARDEMSVSRALSLGDEIEKALRVKSSWSAPAFDFFWRLVLILQSDSSSSSASEAMMSEVALDQSARAAGLLDAFSSRVIKQVCNEPFTHDERVELLRNFVGWARTKLQGIR